MNFVWKQRLKTESKELQLIFKKTGINGQCKINHEYAKKEQSAGKSLSSNDIAVHHMSSTQQGRTITITDVLKYFVLWLKETTSVQSMNQLLAFT